MPVALAVAAVVVSAASAGYSAYSARSNARDQKEALEEQKAMEREAATREADLVKQRAVKLKSTQNASLAASGVDLASKTAGDITAETDRLAEQDVLAIMTNSNNRTRLLEWEQKAVGKRANQATVGAGLSFASSVVSAAGQYQAAQRPGQQAAGVTADTAAASTRTAPRPSLLGNLKLTY